MDYLNLTNFVLFSFFFYLLFINMKEAERVTQICKIISIFMRAIVIFSVNLFWTSDLRILNQKLCGKKKHEDLCEKYEKFICLWLHLVPIKMLDKRFIFCVTHQHTKKKRFDKRCYKINEMKFIKRTERTSEQNINSIIYLIHILSRTLLEIEGKEEICFVLNFFMFTAIVTVKTFHNLNGAWMLNNNSSLLFASWSLIIIILK